MFINEKVNILETSYTPFFEHLEQQIKWGDEKIMVDLKRVLSDGLEKTQDKLARFEGERTDESEKFEKIVAALDENKNEILRLRKDMATQRWVTEQMDEQKESFEEMIFLKS